MKIIEDTYQNVIDKSPDNDGSYMTRYGPDGDRFWFPSDALIIGVRYDMFADNGLDDNAWEENNTNQLMFINTLTNEIANKGKEVLNLYVNVVMYTDYTIKETVNIKR
ncbi:MAG: hypothetical protein IKI04_01195 [Bacilli bacterium]|nr:hypothetical protein [Bacilli bacterium]